MEIINKKINLEELLKQVSEISRIPVEDLKSISKKRIHSIPRQCFMYIARTHFRCEYKEIAKATGRVNHSTVIHGIKTFSGYIDMRHSYTEEYKMYFSCMLWLELQEKML